MGIFPTAIFLTPPLVQELAGANEDVYIQFRTDPLTCYHSAVLPGRKRLEINRTHYLESTQMSSIILCSFFQPLKGQVLLILGHLPPLVCLFFNHMKWTVSRCKAPRSDVTVMVKASRCLKWPKMEFYTLNVESCSLVLFKLQPQPIVYPLQLKL